MTKRKITKINDLEFEPFDKYGSIIPGWIWHKISFDKDTNFGTYISKLEPDETTGDDLTGGYILKIDRRGSRSAVTARGENVLGGS